jgi:murein DD-endopeptidase MepM/ murein hydrolase activator NlpD
MCAVLLWRYRHTALYVARLTWQQWSSSAEPQEIPPMRCPGAPWILPTSGILGVLWDDVRVPPYAPGHPHTGLDLFGEGRQNTIPVYAVADGYLTRLPGWKSAVAIQHQDPLRPGEVVWSYYAHMAGVTGHSFIVDAFPPSSEGVPVRAGDLLGYQGMWSGRRFVPIGMHLHFSVILAAPDGSFTNETILENTLDPSPYLGVVGNAASERPNWQPLQCAGLDPGEALPAFPQVGREE